jgi:hypothetical protein
MAPNEPHVGLPLHPPGWLVSLAYAAVVTFVATWPVWPGYMSYDSLFAYQESLTGIENATWPPLHAYLFALVRGVGADVWGMLVLQTFTLFFGAALIVHMAVRSRALALFLCVAFALAFIYFPTLLGTLFVHWRDVPTVSFALIGVAFWLVGARQRRWLWLAPAATAFGLSAALRYNAFPLIAFVLILMIWKPFLGRAPQGAARVAAVLTLVVSLGLGWASTQWRLPDLRRLPAPPNFAGTQLFDLVGVSACADHSYLPLAVTHDKPMSAYQIRKAYDPRHLLITLRPTPGQPQIQETDANGAVQEAWSRVLMREPGCYLAHRMVVFVELMGLAEDEVFYPTHGVIDRNPHGIALARPRAAAAVNAYVNRNAAELWRRPALLYLGVTLLAAAAALRDRRWTLPLAALWAGCMAYPGLLFLITPAADARYTFPSSVLCLVTGALAFGRLFESWRHARATPSPG